jgi:hypothetical protein
MIGVQLGRELSNCIVADRRFQYSSPFLLQDSPLAPSFKGGGGKGGLAPPWFASGYVWVSALSSLKNLCLVPKPVG